MDVRIGLTQTPTELEVQLGEAGVDKPVLVVFSFRPGIRKIDMQRRDGFLRQQKFQKVGSLDANQAQIRQPGAQTFLLNFPQATEQSFHADKIMFWMQRCIFCQKRAIARAQFHFERLLFWKKRGDVEWFNNRINFVNQCSRCFFRLA